MSAQSRVLATAAREIGYSRWTDKKRGTKYARETQPVFWPRDTWLLANGISYCDLFVTWVFWKALGKSFVTDGGLPAGASYNTDYRASKGGRVSKPPKPGDVLVFDWNWSTAATNHVGILEKVLPSGNYQTIEGNTSTGSSGSQSNGGRVARRTRRPGQVRYVIRPNWSKAVNVGGGGASVPAASKPAGKGKVTVDGRLGRETAKEIQRQLNASKKTKRKLTVDGRLGPDTYKSLQEHLDGNVIDGVIEHQSYKPTELGNGVGPHGWRFTGRGSKGSATIRRLQRHLGVKDVDGILYEGTTRAWQRALNAGKF